MRLRRPMTESTCPNCGVVYSANHNEVRPNVGRCPNCGFEKEIHWPLAYEEELGCGPLIVAAVVFFLLADATGGGGFFGALLAIVVGSWNSIWYRRYLLSHNSFFEWGLIHFKPHRPLGGGASPPKSQQVANKKKPRNNNAPTKKQPRTATSPNNAPPKKTTPPNRVPKPADR